MSLKLIIQALSIKNNFDVLWNYSQKMQIIFYFLKMLEKGYYKLKKITMLDGLFLFLQFWNNKFWGK